MRILFLNLAMRPFSKNQHPTHTLAPLDIGYCCSILEKKGYHIDFIDTKIENLDYSSLISKIRSKRPDIIVIKPSINQVNYLISLSNKLKKTVKYVILIGPVSTLYYNAFIFKNSPILACVLEEPEFALLNLVKGLENKKNINDLEGIAFYDKKLIINKPIRIENLDDLPFPKHDLFIDKGYYFYYPVQINTKLKIGYMLSSRGCPFSCFFCSPIERSSYSKNYFTRSPKNIVNEMFFLCEKGINTIYFIDDVFTLDRKRVLDICDEILRRELKIKWVIQSRVDLLDEEMLRKMKEAGCSTICLGIESFSDNILRRLNKKITISQILKIVDSINRARIMTVGYFIIGNPNETKEEILKTIDIAKKLPLDMIQVHFFTSYPGSLAFNASKKQDYYKFRLVDDVSKVSKKELEQLQNYFYKSFYFRKSFFIRYLFKNLLFNVFNLKQQIALVKKSLTFFYN